MPAMNGRPQPSPLTPPEDPWSVGRLLTWTTDYLKRHGSDSARLDAEVMLRNVLDWQRVQLYTHFEEEISHAARTAFRELVRDRALGTPVAYLVGRKEFYSLSFAVSPAVLIPRPESEFVVVEYLDVTRNLPTALAVDVGTGSGCLAIASRITITEVGSLLSTFRGRHSRLRGRMPSRLALPTGSTFDLAMGWSRLPETGRSTRSLPTPLTSLATG